MWLVVGSTLEHLLLLFINLFIDLSTCIVFDWYYILKSLKLYNIVHLEHVQRERERERWLLIGNALNFITRTNIVHSHNQVRKRLQALCSTSKHLYITFQDQETAPDQIL